ncbi:NAD(P)H-binding protein [Actinoplanes sp. TBRC 11911]|uniref:NAD(P)H-binding protein n=1 Tax=Actinoplanes sp. TBRC 11911 TaxID=2729386 RepID=UPI00145ECCB4|nr:NAD(P)H-binding protein [Actinoplanes sp. TBRC 11911]NMO52630.1 NAD(P)H-binding protein [Actinoplanes sp. TBRC 11911]
MKILVTGATGNVGRMVVDELLALGADDVRALTVSPARAGLPAGVDVVRGFLGKIETLPAALAGVDVMYLAPHVPTVHEVCAMAARAGVRRIVDLAGAKGEHWQQVEDGVEACGVAFTHLEPGEFMSNADLWAPQIRAGDEVLDAYGEAVNAPIAQEDVAAVAARVLVESGHEGRAYELTGPTAIGRRQKVGAIGRGIGRSLSYVDLPHDRALPVFERVLGEYASWYLDGLAVLAKHPQRAVPTVSRLIGRAPRSYERWAREHAAMFG